MGWLIVGIIGMLWGSSVAVFWGFFNEVVNTGGIITGLLFVVAGIISIKRWRSTKTVLINNNKESDVSRSVVNTLLKSIAASLGALFIFLFYYLCIVISVLIDAREEYIDADAAVLGATVGGLVFWPLVGCFLLFFLTRYFWRISGETSNDLPFYDKVLVLLSLRKQEPGIHQNTKIE